MVIAFYRDISNSESTLRDEYSYTFFIDVLTQLELFILSLSLILLNTMMKTDIISAYCSNSL